MVYYHDVAGNHSIWRRMIDAITTKYKAWRAYSRTLHELSYLSDRELADLNIQRFQINDIARQAAQIAKRNDEF